MRTRSKCNPFLRVPNQYELINQWFNSTILVIRGWNILRLSNLLGNLHKVLSYFSVQRQLQAICLLQLHLTMDTAAGSSKHYWQHLFYYGHYGGEICLRLLAFLQVIYPFFTGDLTHIFSRSPVDPTSFRIEHTVPNLTEVCSG